MQKATPKTKNAIGVAQKLYFFVGIVEMRLLPKLGS